MADNKIRVLIVDDSIFFREFMSRALSSDPFIEVVGMASDAFEAQQKVAALHPDVITLDIEMPKMRGTDFLRYLRPRYPEIQVVVISSLSSNVFEVLQAGAVDFVSKPNSQAKLDNKTFIEEALKKIKIAHSSLKLKHGAPPPPPQPAAAPRKTPAYAGAPAAPVRTGPLTGKFPNPHNIIAIGASTGGTEAILAVLKDLPTDIPGIAIVQHMPPLFTAMYADRLNKMCQIEVREAKNGDRLKPGLALLAPGDKQMRVVKDAQGYSIRCEDGAKVSGHCPSVDVLFSSVCKAAGENAVGVILTGMGSDGAKSMLEMRRAGAYTVGQDQASCVVYGMPMVAYNLGGVCDQLPLSQIPDAVVRYLSK